MPRQRRRLVDISRVYDVLTRRAPSILRGMRIFLLALLLSTSTVSTGEGQDGAWVTYRLPGGDVYRIVPDGQSPPENVSTGIDALSQGADAWLNVSPDGRWLVLETERFHPDCSGWACLAVVSADLSQGEAIEVEGQVVHPEGFSAIDSSGDLVVYPVAGPSHVLDLFAVRRLGGVWNAPVNLTATSPYQWNFSPAVSQDGSRVVFDCGDEPYGAVGTSICEVGTDATALRIVAEPDDLGIGLVALHHPDYEPDGDIVFEGDDGTEELWRIAGGAGTPEKISSDYGNDNSPCALPDGRIASLWLNRPGGTGVHELKVMSEDGLSYDMLLIDTDVFDVGLGCGGAGVSSPLFADGFESGDTSAWSTTSGP